MVCPQDRPREDGQMGLRNGLRPIWARNARFPGMYVPCLLSECGLWVAQEILCPLGRSVAEGQPERGSLTGLEQGILLPTSQDGPSQPDGWKETHTKAHHCEISEHWDKEKILKTYRQRANYHSDKRRFNTNTSKSRRQGSNTFRILRKMVSNLKVYIQRNFQLSVSIE